MSRPRLEPSGSDWDELIAAYRAGASFAELGARWGRDPSTIRKAMVRAGVELEDRRRAVGARRRKVAAERRALVEQLHAEGRPVEEIAAAAGYTPRMVRELIGVDGWREKFGVRDAQVVEVYRAGHTVAETARITGVQPTQVGRIVKRAGVSRRRGPVPAAGSTGPGSGTAG